MPVVEPTEAVPSNWSGPVGGAKLPLSGTKRDYLRFTIFLRGLDFLNAELEVLFDSKLINLEDD